MLLIRLDASGLGHAKRFGVFASVPVGTAPRCESAGKPRKTGKATQHPSLALANERSFRRCRMHRCQRTQAAMPSQRRSRKPALGVEFAVRSAMPKAQSARCLAGALRAVNQQQGGCQVFWRKRACA